MCKNPLWGNLSASAKHLKACGFGRIVVAGWLCLSLSSLAFAAPVTVVNQGFELPGTAKTEYWDSTGAIISPTPIDGWQAGAIGAESPGGPNGGPGDSGVESDATYGAWAGYLSALDPSIFQTTGYNISAGESFTLTFASNDTYTSNANYGQIFDQVYLKATLYYLDGVNRVGLGSTTFGPFGYGYADRTLSASAVAAAVGKPIGIEFDNVSDLLGSDPTQGPVVHSWLHIDNVRLDVVPEPSSFVLLCLGASFCFVQLHRKRNPA